MSTVAGNKHVNDNFFITAFIFSDDVTFVGVCARHSHDDVANLYWVKRILYLKGYFRYSVLHFQNTGRLASDRFKEW